MDTKVSEECPVYHENVSNIVINSSGSLFSTYFITADPVISKFLVSRCFFRADLDSNVLRRSTYTVCCYDKRSRLSGSRDSFNIYPHN